MGTSIKRRQIITRQTSHIHKIGVISDTHGCLLPGVHRAFAGVELILHAGDIDTPDVLVELGAIAPVTAIRGNMDSPDLFPRLQTQATLAMHGITAVLIHDREKLKNPPSDLALVVCGHTHHRLWEELADCASARPGATRPPQFILNPGCGGTRTSSPSVAILSITSSGISAQFVDL